MHIVCWSSYGGTVTGLIHSAAWPAGVHFTTTRVTDRPLPAVVHCCSIFIFITRLQLTTESLLFLRVGRRRQHAYTGVERAWFVRQRLTAPGGSTHAQGASSRGVRRSLSRVASAQRRPPVRPSVRTSWLTQCAVHDVIFAAVHGLSAGYTVQYRAARHTAAEIIQVYLLTPMDRATLLNAKSTISHCPPSLITRQRASVDSKLLKRSRNVGYYHIFVR